MKVKLSINWMSIVSREYRNAKGKSYTPTHLQAMSGHIKVAEMQFHSSMMLIGSDFPGWVASYVLGEQSLAKYFHRSDFDKGEEHLKQKVEQLLQEQLDTLDFEVIDE